MYFHGLYIIDAHNLLMEFLQFIHLWKGGGDKASGGCAFKMVVHPLLTRMGQHRQPLNVQWKQTFLQIRRVYSRIWSFIILITLDPYLTNKSTNCQGNSANWKYFLTCITFNCNFPTHNSYKLMLSLIYVYVTFPLKQNIISSLGLYSSNNGTQCCQFS